MKQSKYSDGTCSREIEEDEEDWESTGNEEMSALHARCKYKASVINARNNLNNLVDLVTLCHESLTNSQLIDINEIVCNVLYFHVQPNIKKIEEELSKI